MRAVAFVIPCLVIGAVACEPPGYHKGDNSPDAAGSGSATPDAATGSGSGSGSGSGNVDGCDYTFMLYGHGANNTVWVSGDFVQWAPDPGTGAIALTKDGDGTWSVTHHFATGTIMYKFIVDTNTWIPDPSDANEVDDGYGSYNSLYTCN
ncbi:MAG: glycogen-binding domain-containing protein [Kofleriaceae bacterium]